MHLPCLGFLLHFLNYITTHPLLQRKFYVAFALHFCNANLVFRCNRRATKAFMRLLFLEVFYHLTHFSFSKHKKRLVIGSKFCNKPAFKLSFHLLLWRRPLQRKFALSLQSLHNENSTSVSAIPSLPANIQDTRLVFCRFYQSFLQA